MSQKTEWVWRPMSGKKGWKVSVHPDWANEYGLALAEFWQRVRDGENRRLLLRLFAERIVTRLQPYSAIRRARPATTTAGGVCWVCRLNRKLVTHHIIQVQHGGRNTKRNKVHICHPCHAEIHPWMKGKKTAPRKQPDIPIPTLPAPVFDPTPRLVKS